LDRGRDISPRTRGARPRKDTILTAEATIARRDGLEEIEGSDLDDIRTRVPAGFKLIAVRAV